MCGCLVQVVITIVVITVDLDVVDAVGRVHVVATELVGLCLEALHRGELRRDLRLLVNARWVYITV